jgi:wyosine [tRNA(Phe)-imidazoG37] synthetase (radical SAM superfamily)
MLKLDTGKEETFRLLNGPPPGFTLEKLMENLAVFKSGLVIQSLFVRGNLKGIPVDNTTDEEVEAWLQKIRILRPERVIIYSIERETAANDLQKIPIEKLKEIALKITDHRIYTEVY